MSERNAELASFLRSRRQRLTPEQVGLPQSARRRIATLRREDVAWLADVGITWYTWLEQGRPIKMAADTLERIGAALRLNPSETEYLHKLVHARGRDHTHEQDVVDERVSAVVHSFTEGYAFVMCARWDVLVWNERYGELMQLGDPPDRARNGLWFMFNDAQAKRSYPNWDPSARDMVAAFRVAYADYVGDAGFEKLIGELAVSNAVFAAMWAEVGVLSMNRWNVGDIRDPRSGGVAKFETVSLALPDAPGQTLVFHVPADVPSEAPAEFFGTLHGSGAPPARCAKRPDARRDPQRRYYATANKFSTS
jgi:hypothetical protein